MVDNNKNENSNLYEDTFLTKLLDNIYYIIQSLQDVITIAIPNPIKTKLKSFGDTIYNFIILSILGLLFWGFKSLFKNNIMTMLKLFFTVFGVGLTYFIMKFNNKKTEEDLKILCTNNSNKDSKICKQLRERESIKEKKNNENENKNNNKSE